MFCYRRPKRRTSSGNMLAFMVGIGVAVILAIAFFCFSFVRFLGGHQQQVSSIEKAALTAAKDLSTIVIEDPNLGFISISDNPPTGTASQAKDNYYLSVQSINTVMATTRLDMIIADQLKDTTLIDYANRDYTQAMQARQRLVTELERVTQPGQQGHDINGKVVDLYKDATAAYQANPVNIEQGSSLVPSSLKLTLGWEQNLLTNMQIPQPTQFAQIDNAAQENNCYQAYVDVPYKGDDFVFAAAGNSTTLVDFRNFRKSTDIGTLPYVIPTIVQCQADQQFRKVENNQTQLRVVHSIACAEPSCLIDNRPAPGSLFLSWPGGAIRQFSSLYAILTSANACYSPADLTDQPTGGDYPPSVMTLYSLPILNNPRPPMGQILRVALHDWIRRAGPQLNVQSLFDTMKSGLSTSGAPHADVFQVSSGTVQLNEMPISSSYFLPVSNKQWYAVSGLVPLVNGDNCDIYCTDFVYQEGRIQGGIHAGEPFPAASFIGAAGTNGKPPNTISVDSNTYLDYPTGPSGGSLRPTYSSLSVAAEIRFRTR